MSTNILEMMMSSVGGDFATQAGKFLGASEGMTKAAMGTVFPSLLGAVMQQGSTPAGATSLMNAMNSPSIGTDLGASMTKMFSGGPAANELMTLGTNLVKGLFGDKFSSVTEAAASASGLGSGAIQKMFAMGAPLLLGFLKNQVAAGKLDTNGFMTLLEGQRDFVKSGLDSGLASLLGLGSLGGLFAGVTGALSKAFGAVTEAGTSAIEEATKMAEKVAGLTAESARAAGETASKAAGVAAEASASAVSSAVKTAEAVAGQTAEAAKSAGEIASKAVNVVSEASANAMKTAESMASTVADATRASAEATAKAAGTAVDAGTSAVASVVKGAGTVADATVDAAKTAAEKATKVVSAAEEATKKSV
ncbi:MAG: DUF937 domain-containing protein [Burkholderiales bacterium]